MTPEEKKHIEEEAVKRVELWQTFIEYNQKKDFYRGAIAGVNDLLCSIGLGDCLNKYLEKGSD